MTYSEQGGRVKLDMTRGEYSELLMILGFAAGAAFRHQSEEFAYQLLAFANELNQTNPGFTPYEIPEEYRKP